MKNKIIALALAAICFGSAAAPNVMPAQVIAADSDTSQTVKNMTLDDVQELSKKGKKLDWSDFSGFNVKWRSTIAYSRFAKIELGNDLFLVVGGEPNYRPEVVWLCYKDTETYVDVKTGDVSAFISKYAKTDTVTTTTAAKTTTTTAKTTTTTAKATTTTAKTTTTVPTTTTDSTIKDLGVLEEGKIMTLDDVWEICLRNRLELSWADFKDFKGERLPDNNGNQQYKFVIDDTYSLLLTGNPPKSPIDIFMVYKDQNGVDVRIDDVVSFLLETATVKVTATVMEINENTVIVKPVEGSEELKSYDRFNLSLRYLGDIKPTQGMKLEITYIGGILETNPPQFVYVHNVTVVSDVPEVLKGDANCDGQVDMADVVLIMQAMANPNKYGIDGTAEHHLTEQGKINSDMDGNGLTVGDALAIQRKLLGIEECEKLTIKLNTLIPQNGSEYVEMKADETMVSSYDQASSSLNGMGVWFKFESPKYPVTVSTENGKFRIFNYKGGGLGSVDEVGKSYTVGRSGEVCFAPENGKLSDDYKAEVKVTGEENGKTADLGTLVITKTDKNTKGVLSVTFKKAGSASLAGKKFYYEKEGFGGYCNIEFNEDGTFLYSPGVLSSYLGGGTWKISGDTVILTEKNEGEGKTITNRFKIAGNDIVYIADGSDGLRYMEVKDGEKFSITAADTSDLEIIRQQLSDFFTAEKIDYSVIPRDKMPEQFADKYVFIQVNTADTSYAARYGAFLKSSDIDSSLIKSIPYKIDSDTELNKIRALLYCYILENNINASIDPTDEEADLKNKTVLVKYADSEKTRTQLENFLKEKNIDLKLVEFFAVE
ncbi:dockerin type I repeat-containing protein [Ruminococcus flavefaciens]|uniref:Dockerin domain-containing protein n=1 Tax=Ruminococcus flavefaciens TaxID=1265 RepID=A0A1K1MZW0_RUMFL|nr:dockerin type I repeat-containing protein [Ruminococcus flavefaciens]SFW27558.1 hypothetical protein SAMN02910280_1461 [Ruminococcus flavefaciens]